MSRLHNFAAGPGALPLPVLEEAREALLELPGAGASIIEISHRSEPFAAILAETRDNVRSLLGIGDEYEVLLLQGGAQQQFALIPMNFLAGTGRCAEYVVSGYWANKAYHEAAAEGRSAALWDGAGDDYRRMPGASELALEGPRRERAAYVHYTANETIQGTQLRELPDFGAVPTICDASSDILSRPLQMERCSMLYASAQKNLGPAGLTLVVVHRDLLQRRARGLHPMLDYRELAAHDSVLNTPPVFAIYVTLLVTRWIRDEIGGLQAMARRNRAKAELLYRVLDDSDGFYRGYAWQASRSLMNVTWRLAEEELERSFLEKAAAAGCVELRGHRSVGGVRASLYNALPAESCRVLADFHDGIPAPLRLVGAPEPSPEAALLAHTSDHGTVHGVKSMADGCCTPDATRMGNGAPATANPGPRPAARAAVNGAHDDGRPMCEMPATTFLMGTAADDGFPADGEGPVREVSLSGFAIDLCAVSNSDFAAFVEDSGYVTEAEHFGWSFVFKNHVPKSAFKKRLVRTVPGLAWWYAVDRACWKRPEGPGSNVRKRGDHPVTHVSHADACAYCAWAGKRLPREAEWELAARGGLEQRIYAWGDELTPGGKHYCNIWQGRFPEHDRAADGYAGTCPVRAFPPNGNGLHNVAGNVWEWCADWFSPDFHLTASPADPGGPPRGSNRVMRGGSFLCHRSYCNRYRVAARTSNSPDSSTANLGFRCARSL